MSDNEQPVIPEDPSSPTPPALRVPGPSERGEGSRDWEQEVPSLIETGRVPAEWVAVESGSERWPESLPGIADRLREIGYDIVSPQSGAPPGDSIVARRDLGDRAVVLAIDASGRFRAEITWVVGEWPSRDEVAGVPVQVVDAVSRAVTVTGQMSAPDQVVTVVTGLGTIASWAGVSGSEAS
jgi:hypothetical protein